MSQSPVNNALESLTRWWSEMGVPADARLLAAYRRAAQAQAQSPKRPAPGGGGPAAPPARLQSGTRSPEDWARDAEAAAAACSSLDALAAAIAAFEGCPLKEGANRTVTHDGVAGAPVMVIGEGPGRDEDLAGRPFVGRAGQLLDRMLASIGISRAENALITNVNYWRPPRNRNPEPDELRVCAPFVRRMIALNRPKLIIAAGAVPAKALTGTSSGIMKLRGTRQALEIAGETYPLMPIFHPAYLLRRPAEKARAWRDLQAIERLLAELG